MSANESRFDSLFSAARSTHPEQMSEHLDIQTSKSLNIQTSSSVEDASEQTEVQASKSKNPTFQRTTVYLPKDLHKRFKVTAMNEDKEMSDIMIGLIEQWLNSRLDIQTPKHLDV
jgi:transcriptional regulator GlxA family with amidase domain